VLSNYEFSGIYKVSVLSCKVCAVAGLVQTLAVNWQPPPAHSRNGLISGYKIRYKPRGSERAGSENVVTDGNSRSHEITGRHLTSSVITANCYFCHVWPTGVLYSSFCHLFNSKNNAALIKLLLLQWQGQNQTDYVLLLHFYLMIVCFCTLVFVKLIIAIFCHNLTFAPWLWVMGNWSKVRIEMGSILNTLLVFTARCSIVQNVVLLSHVVRPSVCLSVCDVGGLWSHSFGTNCITISPTSSLLSAQRPCTYSQGNVGNFCRGWGVEKVPPCSTKAAISLKRIKIEDKLLWTAYRNSPTPFRTVPFPTPCGLLFPKIEGLEPPPKTVI